MTDTYKAILIIGDGLGDRPIAELGGKTPLEAANKPNTDRLAAEGECGLMDPIAPGVRAGSDTSHLAILGYDPYKYYTGRGPFEAAGIGMDVKRGDISFRCNFSTVDDSMMIIDRRAGRITEGTSQLAAAVNNMQIGDVTAIFKESVAHRGALVLRGPGLGALVSDTDPHEEGAPVHKCAPLDPNDAAAAKTANAVNEFVKRSYEILKSHPVNIARKEKGLNPANIILPRGAGLAPDLRKFDDLNEVTSACVAETGLIKGVAKYVGMNIVDVPGANGGLDSDVTAIGRAILDSLKSHSFILCNVKGGDVAGHDNQPKAKVAMIERMDQMIGLLLDIVGTDTYIILTADHSTPCAVMDHSGDPVPIAFWGPGVRTDNCKSFGERPVLGGGIGRIRGTDIMKIITNLMGVQEKFGA
ncbi:MAG: 2,3-bisphosphoglycerate-independent phosphoglycerate mutase [Armatimonadota bacterium]|nr:2,3-bisphosphoglycerate-independent phosphoglycerate mutase [Armatimonadota bacterium]